MTYEYKRPAASSGLRLHLNENTAGCSPKVLEAMRRITREEAAVYPDYSDAIEACASRFSVPAESVLLVNGLDEGILLAALVMLRGSTALHPLDAVIVQPAFDMYAACADGTGGRIVDVLPDQDLAFPRRRVLDALSDETRIVYLTSPNNPTGLSIPPDTIAEIASAAPQAMVFLDEAYADFSGESMIDAAARGTIPNLVVGRTFAKAYGLAGVRAGALFGTEAGLSPMRRVIPPYSLNLFAAAALPAALDDVDYYNWYLGEVRQSKDLLYRSLGAHGVRYWPSGGNFVLAFFGPSLPAVVSGLAERGINIRDRSADPGCAGCARMTAGVVAHTQKLVSALEEVMCGAQ